MILIGDEQIIFYHKKHNEGIIMSPFLMKVKFAMHYTLKYFTMKLFYY